MFISLNNFFLSNKSERTDDEVNSPLGRLALVRKREILRTSKLEGPETESDFLDKNRSLSECLPLRELRAVRNERCPFQIELNSIVELDQPKIAKERVVRKSSLPSRSASAQCVGQFYRVPVRIIKSLLS